MSHNPNLSRLAFEALGRLSKSAFVPLGSQGAAQMAQQQMQAGPQAAQAAQPQAAQVPAAPAEAPPPQPQPQAEPQPQAQPPASVPMDQMRAVVQDAVESAQNKPKKPSTEERLTAIEGIVLRMLEDRGKLPAGAATKMPEPDKMQPAAPPQWGPNEQPPEMPKVAKDMWGEHGSGGGISDIDIGSSRPTRLIDAVERQGILPAIDNRSSSAISKAAELFRKAK